MNASSSKYGTDFLLAAHTKSKSHKAELVDSEICGCFYCEETFLPTEIIEWIMERSGKETALCPKCEIDAVLGSEFPVTDKEFLREMNKYWF